MSKDDIITKLHPFSFLRPEFQEVVRKKVKMEKHPVDSTIYSHEDPYLATYFLLKGKINLEDSKGKKSAKGPGSVCFSQGNDNFRHTATAAEECMVLKHNVDPSDLDALLCWEFSLNFMENPDWVFSLYESEMFEHLAPSKLIQFFRLFEKVDAESDQVIIAENQYDTTFYVLTEGLADVYQGKIEDDTQPVSQIEAPQSFGEAALMEDLPRNATIKMSGPGTLMAFDTKALSELTSDLLKAEVYIDKRQIKSFMSKDNCFLLDIRPESEAKASPMKGATSAPIDKPLDLVAAVESGNAYAIFSPYPELNKLIYNLLSLKQKNIYIFNQYQ